MSFRHHPDGLIYINELCLPLLFFQQQEPGYVLPEGATGREYVPNIRHILFDGSSQWADAMPWPEGDGYLAKKAQYQTTFETANTPAPDPQPQYIGLYNELLSPDGLSVFLFVRSLSDQNLPIANAYGDFVSALTTPSPSLPALQSCISNLFAALQGFNQTFSQSQITTMRSLLDRNGFQAISFPLSN